MEQDRTKLNFKSAGAKADANRDAKQGRQFGIGNFFAWAMEKYPKMTLGQLEMKMPQLEREYGQEKAMRRAEPDMKPSVNSAFDDRGEEMKAKGLESIQRIKELAGIPLNEEESELDEAKVKEYKGIAYFENRKDAESHMKKFAPKGRIVEYERGYAIQVRTSGPYLNKSGKIDEEVEKIAVGHVDNESDMLRKELFKIGKYSVELYKMLGKLPEADYPHWWQAKIVKAGDYIGSAKHYLEGELEAPEEESPLDRKPEMDDDVNPSGV